MEIKLFSELSESQVNLIAEKNYKYWKNFSPTLDYKESTGNILAMRTNSDRLPVGIALFDKSQLVGFCTLRKNRLKHHLNINPWLCNVMIFDEFKGKGYAKTMLNYACEEIKTFGYDKIYSWTDQAPDFYRKLGWQCEGKIRKNEGGEGILFSKKI